MALCPIVLSYCATPSSAASPITIQISFEEAITRYARLQADAEEPQAEPLRDQCRGGGNDAYHGGGSVKPSGSVQLGGCEGKNGLVLEACHEVLVLMRQICKVRIYL
jgi:hypothetical protein